MKHELAKVDVLEAAADDAHAREKPSVADTERHTQPQLVAACILSFIVEKLFVFIVDRGYGGTVFLLGTCLPGDGDQDDA